MDGESKPPPKLPLTTRRRHSKKPSTDSTSSSSWRTAIKDFIRPPVPNNGLTDPLRAISPPPPALPKQTISTPQIHRFLRTNPLPAATADPDVTLAWLVHLIFYADTLADPQWGSDRLSDVCRKLADADMKGGLVRVLEFRDWQVVVEDYDAALLLFQTAMTGVSLEHVKEGTHANQDVLVDVSDGPQDTTSAREGSTDLPTALASEKTAPAAVTTTVNDDAVHRASSSARPLQQVGLDSTDISVASVDVVRFLWGSAAARSLQQRRQVKAEAEAKAKARKEAEAQKAAEAEAAASDPFRDPSVASRED